MKKLNEAMLPEVPKSFDNAMRSTLAAICEQEAAEKAQVHNQKHSNNTLRRGAPKRRTMIALVAALALIGSIALAAAMRYNVFDVLVGTTPNGWEDMIQHDLASVMVGDVQVSVKEAAYDGVTLYLLTSARDMTATECFGERSQEDGLRWLNEDEYLDVGSMWTDNFWIDGKNIGMPSMSYGEMYGSDTPGEILYYYAYRLDQDDGSDNGPIYLDGNVRITLPILERQDSSRWIDKETHTMREPDQGVISFTLDCNKMREKTVITHPEIKSLVADGITAWTSQAIFSPMFTYLEISYDVAQERIDAYIAKNGPGYTDEEGNVLWPFTAMDTITDWIHNEFKLVDKDGKLICEEEEDVFIYGIGGYGDDLMYYTLPAVTDTAQEMYFAPYANGVADLERAVRVN